MELAITEANSAAKRGEVPVGAVIVSPKGEYVASARNRVEESRDPTAHAEILAIRLACAKLGTKNLTGHRMFVTLEPCAMCAAAISHARIATLCYGTSDPKSGGVENGPRVFDHPQCHHVPEIFGGIAEVETSRMLKDFFSGLR